MVRQLLDIVIYFARHMVLSFALLGLLAWWASRRTGSGIRAGEAAGRRLLVGLGGALVATFIAIGLWYVLAPGFAGEVEPSVSCLSWLVQTGHPLYTDFDAAERYSILYGPAVFLTNGVFLEALGPSLISAKLASLCGALGSLVFLYAAVARRRRRLLALVITSLAVLYYWTQGFAVYLVRPDALLLCAVGAGVFAVARLRRTAAIVLVMIAAGFAVNLKAHGVVYFLPIFVGLGRRYRWRSVLLAGLGTGVVVALPFVAYPQVSLVNYVGWLTNAMSHGLATHGLLLTLRYAAFLVLPVVGLMLVAPRRMALWRQFRWELLALIPAYGLTLVLAAKPGAGQVHLLPLVPPTMYLLAEVYRAGGLAFGTPRASRQAVVAATLLTGLLAGSVNVYRATRYVDYEIGRTPELTRDMDRIMGDFPDLSISMACGGENVSFQTTWLRPLLVFANNPLLIDPISVMDASLAGRDLSVRTYDALTEGRIALWLVPRHQVPFAKKNWYAPGNPLFSEAFKARFQACYTRRGHSRYFDLWFWNGLDGFEGRDETLTASTGSGLRDGAGPAARQH